MSAEGKQVSLDIDFEAKPEKGTEAPVIDTTAAANMRLKVRIFALEKQTLNFGSVILVGRCGYHS